MGYLGIDGVPLGFQASKKFFPFIRKQSIKQFLSLFTKFKNTSRPLSMLKFGEEIEYHAINIDHQNHKVSLYKKAYELFHKINKINFHTILQPEYGSWMIESIPMFPYCCLSTSQLSGIPDNLNKRMLLINEFLKEHNCELFSVASYPLLGTNKMDESHNIRAKSCFVDDSYINPHPRFLTLTQNIRERKGKKVDIKVPIFMDENTKIKEIYMDAMAFGMGCCCLQSTFDAQSYNHAKYLHDQLNSLVPIFASISACSPVFRGLIADTDLRWDAISQSVDDRVDEEKEPNSKKHICKSRYSTINHYLSDHLSNIKLMNDGLPLPIDEAIIEELLQKGVDEKMAYHIASLHIRDPLVVFDKIENSKHFDKFQTLNWNSLRFKIPMNESDSWRIEFRPMECQLSSIENGILTCILGLFVNLINNFDVNLMLPISLCDKNIQLAHSKESIFSQKFYFRTNITCKQGYNYNHMQYYDYLENKACSRNENPIIKAMTIYEILSGKPEFNYKGLFPLLNECIPIDKKILRYEQFILDRASGKIKTNASFIRIFLRSHYTYKKDSVVENESVYDLITTINSKSRTLTDLYQLYS